MISNIRLAAMFSVGCAILAPTVSHAEFQYVPAGAPETPPPSPAPAAPVQATEQTPAPVVHHHRAKAHKSLPDGTPLTPGGGDVINGFGTQMPLVMALREIVPASYQFAYGDGLKLGRLVDWKGGKPWHDVLLDVLTPMGLTAKESGKVIVIEKTPA